MSNRAAIVRDNLADAATVTASSWLISAPPTRLQNAHTERRWQGELGDTEFILATWSTAQSIDVIELLKCAKLVAGVEEVMTSAAISRIRVSSVDLTGVAGDLYDSGLSPQTLFIDEAYESLAVFLPAPVSAKAVRIDLTEAGAEAIKAGRLVIGLKEVFSISYAYGWGYGYADPSRVQKSAGGQTFVDKEKTYRMLNVTFDFISTTEFYDFVLETDRLNGLSTDILFITNIASTNPSRDSIWGLVQDLSPGTEPSFERHSKSYTIEERK
jgi:hypothetical protein